VIPPPAPKGPKGPFLLEDTVRVSKSTRERVAHIKAESHQAKQLLCLLRARLEEHSGTKRTADKLSKVIHSLEEWQRS
jgi:hypothetical protein